MFDEGIGTTKPIVEQLKNLDLKTAYEKEFNLASKPITWSSEILCELSSLVMKSTGTLYKSITGEFNSARGELRLVNVSAGAGGKTYISWQKVPQKLELFCEALNHQQSILSPSQVYEVYKLSFLAHYQLAEIHPWVDGNGRMARLVMNMIQSQFQLVPSIIKKESRSSYIKSLAECQEKDEPNDFLDFMFPHHIKNLRQQITEYKSSTEGV